MRIENHAFGLYDAETSNVIIFYASTPENPIVYSDFNFIMAASSGAQRGTFTVTDVSYQVGKFYYFFWAGLFGHFENFDHNDWWLFRDEVLQIK